MFKKVVGDNKIERAGFKLGKFLSVINYVNMYNVYSGRPKLDTPLRSLFRV
jgi:hypothetical protein